MHVATTHMAASAGADGQSARPVQPVPAREAPASRGDRGRVNLHWLVQLHWWAILGQCIVVAAAEAWTPIGLPLVTLGGLVVLEIAGNIALGIWARQVKVTDASVAAVMFIDIGALTVVLDLTGGAANPFSTLYLVIVALAAVLLPLRWCWALMGASLLGFATLFIDDAMEGGAHHVHSELDHAAMMDAHLRGMWIAFALAAVFVVFFVQRVSTALASREKELASARTLAARREKLASLATLAAGAAHELSTPLSTIAVVAKELQKLLGTKVPPEVGNDLQLVRDQVARCREILDRMAAHSGETAGEPLALFTVRAWIDTALEPFPARDRVTVDAPAAASRIVGPARALGDTLRGLLKNAVQASPPGAQVTLRVVEENGRVRASVIDQGKGMTPDVLARVGEPFFTTKVPGEGMGLGLFLTRALAEQLGGAFQIVSRPGAGTEAWIELPAANTGERGST
ncbi:MAG TPA: ATP-binding protein [Anaeromyxobacter sp.]|nr:ATP-binding protein [Anaeromyxobacter sp.]